MRREEGKAKYVERVEGGNREEIEEGRSEWKGVWIGVEKEGKAMEGGKKGRGEGGKRAERKSRQCVTSSVFPSQL